METTQEAIELLNETAAAQSELLDSLMEAFYTPVDINQAIQEVTHNFFILIAVLGHSEIDTTEMYIHLAKLLDIGKQSKYSIINQIVEKKDG